MSRWRQWFKPQTTAAYDDDYADLFEPVRVTMTSSNQRPDPDLFELIAAVNEWHDSRRICLDLGETAQPTTHEARLERQALWGRYSKAEAHLMAVARKMARL